MVVISCTPIKGGPMYEHVLIECLIRLGLHITLLVMDQVSCKLKRKPKKRSKRSKSRTSTLV